MTGKTTVAPNLKKRRTVIDKNGNIIEREGFDNESKIKTLKEKQRERAKKLGLKSKDE